jgi:chromosome partitioning protein
MRRIALINQKGGVGKTTSTVNLGAALARAGRRVVMVDLDPQANLSLHLDAQLRSGEPSTYGVLLGNTPFGQALRDTATPGLRIVGSNIDLSGAELELASAMGRETLLRDAIDAWEREERASNGRAPAEYVLLDCPPSLGLLSINGLVAARETIITLQTEFFALQGMSKLVDVVQLLRRRLNPELTITGILPCLYDNRLRLAREVLAEIRNYFPGQVFQRPIAKNVRLAEAPSYGKTIYEYAPDCSGATDYRLVALEMIAQESRDPELASLPRPVAEDRSTLRPAPKPIPSADPAKVRATSTASTIESDAEDADPSEAVAPSESDELAIEREIVPHAAPTRDTRSATGAPAASANAAPHASYDEEAILRAAELPTLPEDAFEIPRV